MSLLNTPFELDPPTPAIGATAGGLDLAEPLSDATLAALTEALKDRLARFFHDLPERRVMPRAAIIGERPA